MPAFQDSLPEPTEGWGLIRPGDDRSHYYRRMDAVCGRAGFYYGPIDPDGMPMPDDCPACRKVLNEEDAEQGFPSAEDEAFLAEQARIERDA
ncbi:MAG: hypothetical protein ACJ73L_12450 [Actinomycetes bacterium]